MIKVVPKSKKFYDNYERVFGHTKPNFEGREYLTPPRLLSEEELGELEIESKEFTEPKPDLEDAIVRRNTLDFPLDAFIHQNPCLPEYKVPHLSPQFMDTFSAANRAKK